MQQNLNPIGSEKGVSLMELAIFLPVIIFFIAGVIDYGSSLREIQAISSASREGARIGASHARINRPLNCNDGANHATGICSGGGPTAFQIGNSDSVSAAARKAACSFITNSGLSGADWFVDAFVPGVVNEDGADFQVVQVQVSKDAQASACILCWDRLLEGFTPKAESTFTLESGCS